MTADMGDPEVTSSGKIARGGLLELMWHTGPGEIRSLVLSSVGAEPPVGSVGYNAHALVCAKVDGATPTENP